MKPDELIARDRYASAALQGLMHEHMLNQLNDPVRPDLADQRMDQMILTAATIADRMLSKRPDSS